MGFISICAPWKDMYLHLSVVIPLAQEDPSLERTLKSLLAQEESIAEILVMRNPGVDTSVAATSVAASHPGRVRFLEVASGLGPVGLWNFAIAAASGEWVSLLTPQVTVRPNFARALGESATRCPTAGIVRAGWTRERPRGKAAEQHTLLSVRTVTHPAEALYEQRFGPKASTAAAAVRRSVWEKMGGLPAEITLLGDWIGDWALWVAAGAHGDTVRNPEVIADIHAAPVSYSKAEEMREMFFIYRDLLPRAASAADLPDPTWIAAASRKRFRDVTIAASNDLRAGYSPERTALAAALEPWARSVEQDALLNRFRAGESIRSFTFGKKMRPALRRVVAAVR